MYVIFYGDINISTNFNYISKLKNYKRMHVTEIISDKFNESGICFSEMCTQK
jgi:hypothetical protein